MKEEVEIINKNRKMNITFRKGLIEKMFLCPNNISVDILIEERKKHKGFKKAEVEREIDTNADMDIESGEFDNTGEDFYLLSEEDKNIVRREWLKIKWKFEKEKR